MDIKVMGIDISKHSFEIHGRDEKGKTMISKSVSRGKISEFIQRLPPCLIGMEACGGAYEWARKFQRYGHEVKLMAPQYVKPYVKRNKTDKHDAAAISEAVMRPDMRFVPIKTIEQQDIQGLHRIREGYVQRRTALVNQTRGLLSEYGFVIKQGVKSVRRALPEVLEDAENGLSDISREYFGQLYEELLRCDEQIKQYDRKIAQLCEQDEKARALKAIPGIGVLTASILAASVGDGKAFKNGRAMSGWLGLVPREHSSGSKRKLLGISKRGDSYIRKLLVQGAQSVIRRVKAKEDRHSQWIKGVIERGGKNKAAVALANKNARIAWALIAKGCSYQAV